MSKYLQSNPRLVKEFNYKKNYPLTPKDFTNNSHKKVWWLCPKGHEWESRIYSRARHETNCPFCSGKEVGKQNNLRFLFPEIAKEWHPTKNVNLKPENVTKGSHKKVWWLCLKGHEWESRIYSRAILGTNCEFCSGRKVSKDINLKILFPEIAKEWHPTKNGNLEPEDVTKGSNKKVWWLCSEGHEWGKRINARTTQNSNCPHCETLNFLFPEISKQWHPNKNGNLKPNEVRKSSNKKVWWLCSKGHEWTTSINHRTSGKNCPKCSFQSSRPEFRILSELETIFKQVDSRYKFKKTEIDIFIKDINVGIEYDGSYFHKNKINKDKNKNTLLEKNNITLIRVRHKPLPKLNKFDVIVELDELTKKDLDNIFNSIYNFCNNKQKNLIKNYFTYKTFVNEESYKKYLNYFPAPIPSKSLASLNIKFINEWNYKKNYPLTPESYSTKSGQKVWWLCSEGHEWESRISTRTTQNSNCPHCETLKFLFPEIAKEWHPTKNNNLCIDDIKKSSGQKVWWLCSEGHEWQAAVFSRTNKRRKSNCPFCWKKNKFPLKEKLTF